MDLVRNQVLAAGALPLGEAYRTAGIGKPGTLSVSPDGPENIGFR